MSITTAPIGPGDTVTWNKKFAHIIKRGPYMTALSDSMYETYCGVHPDRSKMMLVHTALVKFSSGATQRSRISVMDADVHKEIAVCSNCSKAEVAAVRAARS
jgi:hypothetical protein